MTSTDSVPRTFSPQHEPKVAWRAQWIGRADAPMNGWRSELLPSPMMRREFEVGRPVSRARIAICGLGFSELRLDGEKVGDDVLTPTPSQFDRRAFYVTHDVTDRLTEGRHAIGVMLGNGWYNCSTPEIWHFDKATWRDRPKLLLQLDITYDDGTTAVIGTGPGWRLGEGPIRFDALRNGETYDARHELPGWDTPGYDDAQWQPAGVLAGPGGELEPLAGPPCRVADTLTPVDCWSLSPGTAVYDLGQSIAGWTQLRLEMDADQTVTLTHSDQLDDGRDLDMREVGRFIFGGDAQTDRYTAAKAGPQVWEPRFTYHGFRYVRVSGLTKTPTPDDLRGRVVQTGFESAGGFECSIPVVNKLQDATRWAYRGNFVGIPTDCPHREKNGWTGDAQLAVETGLMNFDSAEAYLPWLVTLADSQRPSGQLPGIAPTAGWGYNWGSGPAWDSALFIVPAMIHLYTGRTEAIQRLYPAMQRYIGFCESMVTEGIVHFGLGDWCAPKGVTMAPAALTSTAYYFKMLRLLALFSNLLGDAGEAQRHDARARDLREAFHRHFYRGDGLYAGGEWTSLASPVYHGLAEPADVPLIARRLAERVEAADATAQFGILGAKYIPRVLADHGHEDLAFRLFTQPSEPGWAHWIERGATTLWEKWDGAMSRNHIMFGDLSAWMFHYVAGIQPDPADPGFRRVVVRPRFIKALDWFRAEHRTPLGWVRSGWKRTGGGIELDLEVPEGMDASLDAPGGDLDLAAPLSPGKHRMTLPG